MENTHIKKLWNNSEASKFLGISPFTLRGKVSRREIPYIKLGRRVLFDCEDLRRFVEASKIMPRPRRVNGDGP